MKHEPIRTAHRNRKRRALLHRSESSRPRRNGFTLWFTGLPGSGKSTLACAVQQALLKQGLSRLEILDGDAMREALSRGLGFTREDRTTNMLRIAWVAQLLIKHEIPTLIASIGPYKEARDRVRSILESAGGPGTFVEVHVDCPLDVCMHRDPKGLYAQARSGKLTNLTGFNDTYEVPEHPDIRVNTAALNVPQAVELILRYLRKQNLLRYAPRPSIA